MTVSEIRSALIATFLCAAWAVAGPVAPLVAQGADPEFVADIEARVGILMDAEPVPGMAIGIVDGETLVYSAGFGLADRTTGRPVSDSTLFQIGSSSKSFTTTLMGMLRDEGRIDFDDPLADHLSPELRIPTDEDGTAITLRHLASHQSGIPRQPPTLRRAHGDAPVLAFTHFELHQSIERSELEHPVGSEFMYSNFGFAILGHVLERTADEPYETLLQRRIFRPLGMDWSTVTLWPRHMSRLALPYYPNPRTGELENYTPWDAEALAPAGGITSSVRDMARYLALHMRPADEDRAPIAGATLHELHQPQVDLSETTGYALGWIVRELDAVGSLIEHGGEVDGYTTYLGFLPEQRVGVVILVNAGDGPLGDLGDWILTRFVTGPADG